jgi:hypothetical protein
MINDYTFGYAIIFVTFDFLSFQLSGFVTQYRLLLGYLSLVQYSHGRALRTSPIKNLRLAFLAIS